MHIFRVSFSPTRWYKHHTTPNRPANKHTQKTDRRSSCTPRKNVVRISLGFVCVYYLANKLIRFKHSFHNLCALSVSRYWWGNKRRRWRRRRELMITVVYTQRMHTRGLGWARFWCQDCRAWVLALCVARFIKIPEIRARQSTVALWQFQLTQSNCCLLLPGEADSLIQRSGFCVYVFVCVVAAKYTTRSPSSWLPVVVVVDGDLQFPDTFHTYAQALWFLLARTLSSINAILCIGLRFKLQLQVVVVTHTKLVILL